MLRFGAHAFVWVGEWTTDSGSHAIEQAAETGFDFIEIPLLARSMCRRHLLAWTQRTPACVR